MDPLLRIEGALDKAVELAESSPDCPPQLAAAMRYAVFPGGARIRPRLCLAVAMACDHRSFATADGAAAAIELLHCASLVHDDLPCFDDADLRRGKASLHVAFGEPIAVLTGDSLIVLAFQVLARVAHHAPDRLADLLLLLSDSVGVPRGIVAGQAWEAEPEINLSRYQQEKTGSLFAAATMAGATAAGISGEPWRELGDKIGEAYQVADDIRDVIMHPDDIGKPVGQDEWLGRPSATRQLGLEGAIARFKSLVAAAVDSIPECPGQVLLQEQMQLESSRFLPKEVLQRAA